MERYAGIRPEIREYAEREIVPKYAGFDEAHREDHALTVIGQAMKLYESMPETMHIQVENPESGGNDGNMTVIKETVDKEMLFVAAACHDLGLVNGREHHHTDSAAIIRQDARLREWFSPEQIEVIAQAAEDHRASGKRPPRSIYGMLLAEADRVIEPDTIIRRTLQFGFARYPELDAEQHVERAIAHLKEKYGKGGYLKLWIPWSDNAARLHALQDVIEQPDAIHAKVQAIFRSCRT